jgi:hypothetical protein
MKESKFKVGDKVIHTSMRDEGFIEEVNHNKRDVFLTANIYYTYMYRVKWIGRYEYSSVPCFEEFLEIDAKYYLRENRDSRINELLN